MWHVGTHLPICVEVAGSFELLVPIYPSTEVAVAFEMLLTMYPFVQVAGFFQMLLPINQTAEYHMNTVHRYVHINMNIPNVNSLTSDDRFIHVCVIMLSVTSWLSLFSVCHILGADF